MHMAYVFGSFVQLCLFCSQSCVMYLSPDLPQKYRHLKNTQSWSDSFSFRKILCTLNLNIFVPTQEWQRVEVQVALKIVIKQPTQFPLAPMGVLAPGSAHATPSAQPPIDTSGNFPPHLSAESPSNISPNP